jgi:isoleucyl-tRNA synthetase
MKALGKGFGKDSFKLKALIEAADGDALKAEIDAGRKYRLGSGDEVFEIGPEHVTFTEKLPADIFSAPMTDAMVYVDVALTPDLEAEGYAREVIRRIQEMRKQLDLAVEDMINAEVAVSDKRVLALLHSDATIAMIGDEVRAKFFGFSKDGTQPDTARFASVKEWDVEDVGMTIGIGKAI